MRIYDDRAAAGAAAAECVARTIEKTLGERASARVVFASAPSQADLLRSLRATDAVDWSRVVAFHMDEYIGLPPTAPQRFSRFLQDSLFDAVSPGAVHLLDPGRDPVAECQRYAALLRESPVDLVCLGIGDNGHLAFNEPGVSSFHEEEWVKVVALTEESRTQQVLDGCFETFDDVPDRAVTLTIPALLSAARMVCTVPGARKSKALRAVLDGPVDEACPATALRSHPAAELYADRPAYEGSENARGDQPLGQP
ncbi:MAG: 6-phosphogluconolactonase [Acidimicrobiales bacterium]